MAILSDVKTMILEACKWAAEQGLKVEHGDWGIYRGIDGTWRPIKGSCCPLGALIVKEQSEWPDMTGAAAQLLGESRQWVNSFTAGVDGTGGGQVDIEAYELGEEIITRVAKGHYEPTPLVSESNEPEATDPNYVAWFNAGREVE